MSTTSEYYIQNMSMSEFEQYYQRLQRRERKRTRQQLKSQLDREIQNALRRSDKRHEDQRRALRSRIEQLTQESQERAECNQRALEGLEGRLETLRQEGDARAAQVSEAIVMLRADQADLAVEIRSLHDQDQALERSIKAVRADLEREAEARRDLLARAEGYCDELTTLFQTRHPTLPTRECERFQLTGELSAVERGLTQAREQRRKGLDQAAASTMAQCVRDADALVQTLALLEDQERALSLEIKLRRESGRCKLEELNREEVRRYLATPIDQLSSRLSALSTREAQINSIQNWDERRASLRELRREYAEVDEAITTLYQRYDELIEQSAHREVILRSLVQALVEVWGGAYEMDVYLEDPQDLNSALIFRTKRGTHAPNVRARIELDGRLEANLTGYRGVECAHDEEQLREALSRRSAVEVVRTAHQVTPDAPNPDDVGPYDSGPAQRVAHTAPVPSSAHAPDRAEVPQWAKRARGAR